MTNISIQYPTYHVSTVTPTSKDRVEATIELLSGIFWGFDVTHTPGHYLITNTYEPDMPTDITVQLSDDAIPDPAHHDPRRLPDPVFIFRDNHDHIAKAIGVQIGGHETTAVFGQFIPNPDAELYQHKTHELCFGDFPEEETYLQNLPHHTFIPTDPKDATHVWVHTEWDLRYDPSHKVNVTKEHCDYFCCYTDWDLTTGSDNFIFPAGPSLSSVVNHFQSQLDSVRAWAADFYNVPNDPAATIELLRSATPKAETIGWQVEIDEAHNQFTVHSLRSGEASTTTLDLDACAVASFIREVDRLSAILQKE